MDLQHLYRLPGTNKVGMKVMAVDLIDPWYADMKALPYKAHSFWEKIPLYKINKDYASIDGFVVFELYRVMLERIAAGQPLGYQLQVLGAQECNDFGWLSIWKTSGGGLFMRL